MVLHHPRLRAGPLSYTRSVSFDPIAFDSALSELRERLGAEVLSTTSGDLFAYARDLWPRLTVQQRDHLGDRPPDAVLRPRDEDQVATALGILSRYGVPVVAYGAGSGVCGGAVSLSGGVVVDVKALDGLKPVDAAGLQVSCGPGMILQTLEERLNHGGYTLGHFPSSILCCSVGGCVAARGAGKLSSRYGKVEDMVTGLRVATPHHGVLSTGSLDPEARSTDWSPLFLGSEGRLGVITAVRLRVHPLPAVMAVRGMRFESVGAGLEGLRQVLQEGLRPSVLRLYDPLDTVMAMAKGNDGGGAAPRPGAGDPRRSHQGPVADGATELATGLRAALSHGVGRLLERFKRFADPTELPLDRLLARPALANRAIGLLPRRSLAVVAVEGEGPVAEQQLQAVVATWKRLGAEDLGPAPGERWYRARYHVSFKLPRLLQQGGFADTMETAAPWSRVPDLYDAVRRAVSPHALVMAHMSHAYPEGCSIYFTLVGFDRNPEELLRRYERTWQAALAAAVSVGATITHHHGVGVLKRDFMDREHGDSRALFDVASRALDPEAVLNPGKLFPPRPPAPGPVPADPRPRLLDTGAIGDCAVTVGVDWPGVELAATLTERGLFLPPLGREFLRGTVGDWLASPAVAAHVAVHASWEHPLLAVEGRLPDGRRWRSGRLPRSTAGPGWSPFGVGEALPLRPVSVTLRVGRPPYLRQLGFDFPDRSAALGVLAEALRGAARPLAGEVVGWRVHLCFFDPDGFPLAGDQVARRLERAGGEALGHDETLAWWETHWAHPAREGLLPDPPPDEVGLATAVVSWRRAGALLDAVETLTGGPVVASGSVEAPLETGCTLRWSFRATGPGKQAPALVAHQVRATVQAYGGRLVTCELPSDEQPGAAGDEERLARILAAALEVQP